MERVSRPRAAIFRVENSRKIFSSCAPRMSTLPTFGTVKTFARMSSTRSRNCRWLKPSLVNAYMLPKTSPKRSLKPGPITPCGKSPLMSAIMLRTRAQVGATSAAFVVSRR